MGWWWVVWEYMVQMVVILCVNDFGLDYVVIDVMDFVDMGWVEWCEEVWLFGF